MKWIVGLLVAACGVACGKKPAPTCEELAKHLDPMYAALDSVRRREEVMHSLSLGRGGCSKLTEEQRRCLGGVKTFDETYACVGKVRPRDEKKDFVAMLTQAAGPPIAGPIGVSLQWTAHVDSLPKQWCEREAIVPAWCELKTDEYPGVVFRVFRDFAVDDKNPPIGPYTATLAGAGLRDKLIAAWGPPRDTKDAAYWYSPGLGLRAALRNAKMQGDPPGMVDLEFNGYRTLAELIGAKDELFGFELRASSVGPRVRTPLLGATADEVRDRFKPRIGGNRVHLWPHETGTKPVEIVIGSELDSSLPERALGYRVKFADADPKELEKLLAEKLGTPHDDAGELVFRDKPRIALDGTTLLVGDAPPL